MSDRVLSIPISGESSNQLTRESVSFDLRCYLCGPENRLAELVLNRLLGCMASPNDRLAQNESVQNSFLKSPIVFFGPAGCGKTHIARGISIQWRASFGASEIWYSTAADFARRILSSDSRSARHAIRESLYRPSLVVLDDLDQLPNRSTVLWELRCLIDIITGRGGLFVATSSAAPDCILSFPPSIRSRLVQGLVVPIAQPGVHVRREVARRLASMRGMTLTDRELSEVAGSLDASPRSIVRRLQRLELSRDSQGTNSRCNCSKSVRSPGSSDRIDEPLVPMLPTITAITARYFKLASSELRSHSRVHTIVHARGIAMYLARELSNASLSKIGQEFGNRDHSTVLHACRKIAKLISRDESTRTDISQLSRIITST